MILRSSQNILLNGCPDCWNPEPYDFSAQIRIKCFNLLSAFSLWSSKTIKILVEVDHRYYRPTEVELLMGDYSKAKRELGWQPKVKFEELVKIMAKADWGIELAKKQLIEAKRERIAERAKNAEKNYKKGKVKSGTVKELFKYLESD